MNHSQQRNKLRAVLAGSKCLSPARVYDALSVRVAEAVGYEIGLLAGAGVAASTLAAPHLVVHTITEYADQIRCIIVKALRETYTHLYNGGAPEDLGGSTAVLGFNG